MKSRIIKTRDGSHSLYVEELDEHYHSIHGAVSESRHVFLQYGLRAAARSDDLTVFEFGFGTGLNTLLTFLYANKNRVTVRYETIEKFPVPRDLTAELNYCAYIPDRNCKDAFQRIHRAEYGKEEQLSPYFTLKKIHSDFESFRSEPDRTDVIYYDAFAPRVQPELWTREVFEKLFAMLKEGGTLVTYCAKGEVRRNMVKAGFEVDKCPGPPGKREMLRGVKQNNLP